MDSVDSTGRAADRYGARAARKDGAGKSSDADDKARSQLNGYMLAVGITSSMVLVRVALNPWMGDRPWLIAFIFPILLSAYVGGVKPGIVATVIAVIGTKFFLAPTVYSLWFEKPLDLVQWVIMLVLGVLISVMNEALHRSRRRAEEALGALEGAQEEIVQNERRFRALIERGGDSIALIDAGNRITYVSPAVTNVEGYLPEELIGRNGMEHTHPEDLGYVREAVEKLVANPGKPFPVLWRRKHKKGHWIWLEGIATNLLDSPAVGAIVVNYRDVTGRKEAEQKIEAHLGRLDLLHRITRAIGERQDVRSVLQVVVNALEDNLAVDFSCVLMHDMATNVLRVVQLGIKSEPLAVEMGMSEKMTVPIDENGLSRCLGGQLVYEADISGVKFPFPERLAAGGLRSLVIAPLLVESNVFGVLIAARRATEGFVSGECEFLKQLSEHVALASHQTQLYGALQQAYDDLRQTQQAIMQQERLRALGQMASGIAHDINNAITPVSFCTELLLENEPGISATGRGKLEIIKQAINDVAQTVARMREFYRQREQQMALEVVDLNRLTREVVDLTRARWSGMPQQKGDVIEMRTDLLPELPPIMGVESELREALINLIFNGVDAMGSGGTLTLRTTVLERGLPGTDGRNIRQVQLEVTDTGAGMSEETRRRCFEPFFTTKGERGTGLGLAMVYGTVKRHGAEIEIDSAVGNGTTMRLRFVVPETPVGTVAPVQTRGILTRMKILVVDDDPMISRVLREVLETDGHVVKAVNGGQAGIDAFMEAQGNKESYSVVITDLGMPHVDGRKVAKAVKDASPGTPVILLTGWGMRLMAEGDVPEHVDRVMSKPPKLEELRRALAEVTAAL